MFAYDFDVFPLSKFSRYFVLIFCMYKLNLNKDIKIEEMKIFVFYFYMHILMTQIDLCKNLLITLKKLLNVWKANVLQSYNNETL